MSDDLAAAKETAWRELRDLDIALEQGRIDKHGWHEAVRAIVEPAYLSGENPRAQSGHSGDAARWEQARRLLIDALPGDCALLDVGCANGHLMESIVAWAAEDAIFGSSRTESRYPGRWRSWHDNGCRSGRTGSGPRMR